MVYSQHKKNNISLLERLVSLYAPHSCLGCGQQGLTLCEACSRRLPVPDACCYLCRKPSPLGRTCTDCRRMTPLVSVNGAVLYEGIAKDLLWKLKFERLQSAADAMAELMVYRFASFMAADVLIVPVPTATSRVRMRGYDQAVLLARSLAARTGCQYTPLLMRMGHQEQIGAGRQQRRNQLQSVFRVRNGKGEVAVGARILLIDDVLTTGATTEEAARCLQAAGAKTVGALVFARV